MSATLRTLDLFAARRVVDRGVASEPYLLGWHHGRKTGVQVSRDKVEEFLGREVAAGRLPSTLPIEWHDDYLAGRRDGVDRDRTRVENMMKC